MLVLASLNIFGSNRNSSQKGWSYLLFLTSLLIDLFAFVCGRMPVSLYLSFLVCGWLSISMLNYCQSCHCNWRVSHTFWPKRLKTLANELWSTAEDSYAHLRVRLSSSNTQLDDCNCVIYLKCIFMLQTWNTLFCLSVLLSGLGWSDCSVLWRAYKRHWDTHRFKGPSAWLAHLRKVLITVTNKRQFSCLVRRLEVAVVSRNEPHGHIWTDCSGLCAICTRTLPTKRERIN